MIKVLIVEDSAVVREFLVHILSCEPGIRVIGTANNGMEAVEAMQHMKPDVITMDIHMPKMNGLDATRRIMETHPTPIVIVSGSQNLKEMEITFKAMEAGALAVVSRPKGPGHPDYEATVKDLIQTVRLMSEVKVVKRWPQTKGGGPGTLSSMRGPGRRNPAEIAVVAMGASTGGPAVIQKILSGLSGNFPLPLLIVQHIARGFVLGFAEWLSRSSSFPVAVARDGETLLPGRAYVAPDGFDLGVNPGDRVYLRKAGFHAGPHPSVSYLFRSVLEVYGANAAGVLLTGMGKDGAAELRLMKERGALTIVQDEESSVVYGMPEEAIKLGAATYVLPPEMISRALMGLASSRFATSLPNDGGGR